MFTNKLKRHKGHLIRRMFSNIQTYKQSNVQTFKQKKVRSKLKRSNESQVIKYITNSKTKQPKTL